MAGIIFAVILGAVLVLMHSSVPSRGSSAQWAVDPDRRRAVGIALALIPFAGISFLWFIGVIRSRLADREDRLFATVFLGSGLLFVALLFVTSAVLGSLLTLFNDGVSVDDRSLVLLQTLAHQLMGTYGARMAAVFTLSVTSLAWRNGLLPRWLLAAGLLTAVILLVTPPIPAWGQLLFPAWVLAMSVQILLAWRRANADAA